MAGTRTFSSRALRSGRRIALVPSPHPTRRGKIGVRNSKGTAKVTLSGRVRPNRPQNVQEDVQTTAASSQDIGDVARLVMPPTPRNWPDDMDVHLSETQSITSSCDTSTAAATGLPEDGRWHYCAAYATRFYLKLHGEREYLLGTPDRWMKSEDFKRSEDELDGRLMQEKESTSTFSPYTRAHQAECGSTLWSHIDAVIDKTDVDGKSLFKIRWKACWTLESDVDDLECVRKLLAREDEKRGVYRSKRLVKTEIERDTTNKAVMEVVWL
ncbi:hypothetical protein LTR05_008599 [Lithohypha guttulata]|uniref:Uncharacterized protein n=1 Tax=Lithohypha guttulata TaxID=1690604 RepID=A0AAN7ST76_9EURO|nr:hypothetical protein LTR05_008599 [Lithohypha guttulata]